MSQLSSKHEPGGDLWPPPKKSDVNCHLVDASMLSYLFVKIMISTTTLSEHISTLNRMQSD
jgi:hypothetical protein